jgi:hypothetical protein
VGGFAVSLTIPNDGGVSERKNYVRVLMLGGGFPFFLKPTISIFYAQFMNSTADSNKGQL